MALTRKEAKAAWRRLSKWWTIRISKKIVAMWGRLSQMFVKAIESSKRKMIRWSCCSIISSSTIIWWWCLLVNAIRHSQPRVMRHHSSAMKSGNARLILIRWLCQTKIECERMGLSRQERCMQQWTRCHSKVSRLTSFVKSWAARSVGSAKRVFSKPRRCASSTKWSYKHWETSFMPSKAFRLLKTNFSPVKQQIQRTYATRISNWLRQTRSYTNAWTTRIPAVSKLSLNNKRSARLQNTLKWAILAS